MASGQLDKQWDTWMESMSASYASTVGLLEQDNQTQAASEFRRKFVPTVKKLYSEAAETYPVRFKKIDEWCDWTKKLYGLTRTIEKSFSQKDYAGAEKLLPELRKHFFALHLKADVRKSNDYIYVFHTMLASDSPSVSRLKSTQSALGSSPPSLQAKANANGYQQAKAAWEAKVGPILEGGTVGPDLVAELREATDVFYKAYGIQFE